MARKDLLSRLADAGEEAIAKLADAPGSDRLMGFAQNMRERMDEMQRKVRGIEDLERRVTALEQQLAAQGGSGSRSRGSTGAARSATSGTRKTSASPKAGSSPGSTSDSDATEASRSRAASTPRQGGTGSTGGSRGDSPG